MQVAVPHYGLTEAAIQRKGRMSARGHDEFMELVHQILTVAGRKSRQW